MNKQKLIDDTFKVDGINKGGKVFEKGKYSTNSDDFSFSYLRRDSGSQALNRVGR